MKIVRYALAGWMPFGRRHCICCNHAVWAFMPYQGGSAGVPSLMRELKWIGSDAEHFECPRCGAHDRERHLFMYMEASGLFAALPGQTVLHFAPEKRLSRRISAMGPARHVRCDLHPREADMQRVDMLAMDFPSESFDVVIANHVLEHVSDDNQALAEIRRVLKVGGHAILQTPFSDKLTRTWSDPGIDDDRARLQAYGQADHVRLYGRDIFDRFCAAGLASRVSTHKELLQDLDTARSGVNPAEPFMLFQRSE